MVKRSIRAAAAADSINGVSVLKVLLEWHFRISVSGRDSDLRGTLIMGVSL